MNKEEIQEEIEEKIKTEFRSEDFETPEEEAQRIKDEDIEPPKEIKTHETHSTCNKRLLQKGGKAECCWCVPHSDCDFMKDNLKEKIIGILKRGWSKVTLEKYDDYIADQILQLFVEEKQKWIENLIRELESELIQLLTK
jgi:hypothetical protein